MAGPRLRAGARVVLVCLVALGVGCRQQSGTASAQRVILISIDTLRPDHLGAYGYPRPTSPHLDAFAKQGVLFEDVTSPSPWTLPAHASLFTGVYPSRHGLTSSGVTLSASITTLAASLADHGFATGAVVNSNYLSNVFGLDRGFQKFRYVKEEVNQREPSRAVTDQAVEWSKEFAGQRSFLFVHYYDVHSDYRSRPEYEREFVRPYVGPADGSTAQMVASRTGKVVFDRTDAQHLTDLYDAGIRQMDDELARLLGALGDDAGTLVVIISDHGEEFLEHGGVLHGRTQFDELVRVPLMMRGPGVPPGVRVATTASLVDVMPTILGAAGVAAPAGLDGADLAPTWHGGGAELGERYLSCEADHNNAEPDVTRAVRHGKDKLHFDRLTGQAPLFDLGTDPGEHTDTAAHRPAIAADLRAHLDRFREVRPIVGGSVKLTPEQMERLKSLGYVR